MICAIKLLLVKYDIKHIRGIVLKYWQEPLPGLEDGDNKDIWNFGNTAHIYLMASPQKGIHTLHKLFYF
jgi:hypothetical protein